MFMFILAASQSKSNEGLSESEHILNTDYKNQWILSDVVCVFHMEPILTELNATCIKVTYLRQKQLKLQLNR